MSGSLKQKNYTNYLETFRYNVSAIDDKNIKYVCPEHHHVTEITLTSFANKKAKFKDTPLFLCTGCKDIFDREASRVELESKSNHKIVAYHDKENVDFICNNCGAHKTSTKKSLESSIYCSSCQNIHQRKPFEELERQVKEKGMVLLTTKGQYTDNKNILVSCECGSQWKTSLADITRGRRCMKCRNRKDGFENL